jgi:hypothetical protein
MRKSSKILIATTIGLATALAVGLSPAFATTTDVLTYGSSGGTNVAVHNTLSTSLSSGTTATFYDSTSGTEGLSCTGSTMTDSVSTNPAAPGTASLSTTGLTYSGCTSNIFGFDTVEAAQVFGLPYATSAVDSGSNPISISGVIFRILLSGSQGTEQCNYEVASGALTGSTSYSKQDFQLYIQSDQTCPGDMYASATYGTIHDTSVSGSPQVFMN